jgi:hypothetical protein
MPSTVILIGETQMFKRLITIILFAFSSVVLAVDEADVAIHEELRELLQGIELAVNEGRYGDLAPLFHENLRVTTINQEVISSLGGISEYFDRWFGADGFLQKVDMKLEADAATELYAEKTFGVVHGTGIEKYILSDSRAYDMRTRWTATVLKGGDGIWRILTLHIGTNFLDNPILDEAENSLLYFAGGGFLAGGVLMLVLIMIRRVVKKARSI